MKKVFGFLCLIILLTGCQANYTLYMNTDNSFEEMIVIQQSNDKIKELGNDLKKVIQERYNQVNGFLKYPVNDLSIISDNEKSGIKRENKYKNYEELNESIVLKNVNAKVKVVKEDYTTLYIFNNFDYFTYLEETEYDPLALKNISISIDIPYEVIETNAQSHKDTVYEWNLNDGLQNRTIYIKYNEKKIVRRKNWNDNLLAFIVIGIIIIGIGITSFIVWNINKKNNKI